MQQAKNLVSCVVERRKSDDKEQSKKRNAERVSIICESNEPRRQEYVYFKQKKNIYIYLLIIII